VAHGLTRLLCSFLYVYVTDCIARAVMDQAYVTLATNDSYAIGALVLGHSLRNTGTTRSLVVMVTGDVTETFRYSYCRHLLADIWSV